MSFKFEKKTKKETNMTNTEHENDTKKNVLYLEHLTSTDEERDEEDLPTRALCRIRYAYRLDRREAARSDGAAHNNLVGVLLVDEREKWQSAARSDGPECLSFLLTQSSFPNEGGETKEKVPDEEELLQGCTELLHRACLRILGMKIKKQTCQCNQQKE